MKWREIANKLHTPMGIDANTLPEYVYRLFSNKVSYETFATERWGKGQWPKAFISLENIHGSVHGSIGGDNGHMGTIEVAAFDPIFW